MPKLVINVEKCHILHLPGRSTVRPRVYVTVDDRYHFQTRIGSSHQCDFNESFVVGNTHHLAVIEIEVYDSTESTGLLPGLGHMMGVDKLASHLSISALMGSKHMTSSNVKGDAVYGVGGGDSNATDTYGGAGGGQGEIAGTLIGRCYISVQRLVHGRAKKRDYTLARPLRMSDLRRAGVGGAPASVTSSSSNATDGVCSPASTFTSPGGRRDVSAGGVGDSAATGSDLLGDLTGLALCDDIADAVAGSITVSLESDVLGESPRRLAINDAAEAEAIDQLRRLLLCHDRPRLAVMDLMIGHVRDRTERTAPVFGSPTTTSAAALTGDDASTASARRSHNFPPLAPAATDTSATDTAATAGANDSASAAGKKAVSMLVQVGKNAAERTRLSFRRPPTEETFQECLARLCRYYGEPRVPPVCWVRLRVDGCTGINREEHNMAAIGSDKVYVLARTASEEFISEYGSLQSTVLFTEGDTVDLAFTDPQHNTITLVLMGRSYKKHYEIGRTSISIATLSRQRWCSRNMFLVNFDNLFDTKATGVLHVSVRALNFDAIPPERQEEIDSLYDRLGRFLRRYEPTLLPAVDALIRNHAEHPGRLDELVEDEVMVYGREPGSVRLTVTVDSVASLHEGPGVELNKRQVRVRVSMGSASAMTRPKEVRRFAPTNFEESFVFDVVRETDMVCIEVVRASDPATVYGRVDFTCLNTQRGVENKREFYLVGNACTTDAFLSGTVQVRLFSDQVGHRYVVDEALERMYALRLQRYAYRRLPESLHRINVAIATVYDLETFMAELAQRFGEEDRTYAIYLTVLGCRDLEARFGGVSPYVVVRVGVDAYHTKYVRDNREPDFYEYCEFTFDRPSDHYITLVVMDHSDLGRDYEVGRAVIPLIDIRPGQQYHDFLPLHVRTRKGRIRTVGTVGFKFTVVDLKLVDPTRTALVAKRFNATAQVPTIGDPGADVDRATSGGLGGGNDSANAGGVGMDGTGGGGGVGGGGAGGSRSRANSVETVGPANLSDLNSFASLGDGDSTRRFGWMGRRFYSMRHRMMTPFLMMARTGWTGGGGAPGGSTYNSSEVAHDSGGGGGGISGRVSEVSADSSSDDIRSRLSNSVEAGMTGGAAAALSALFGTNTEDGRVRYAGNSGLPLDMRTLNLMDEGDIGIDDFAASSDMVSAFSSLPQTESDSSSYVSSHRSPLDPSNNNDNASDGADSYYSYYYDYSYSSASDGEEVDALSGEHYRNDDEDDGNVASIGEDDNAPSTRRSARRIGFFGRPRSHTAPASAISNGTAHNASFRHLETERQRLQRESDMASYKASLAVDTQTPGAAAAAASPSSQKASASTATGGNNSTSVNNGAAATASSESATTRSRRTLHLPRRHHHHQHRKAPDPGVAVNAASSLAAASDFTGSGVLVESAANGTSADYEGFYGPTYHRPRLHVRLLYCQNLPLAGRRAPNPYVMLSTLTVTHRSRVVFDTVNPQYNEEFVFDVNHHYNHDFLRIVVLTDTAYGAKTLGQCIVSLNNVQRDVARTRWVSLVQCVNTTQAFQLGSVCISLTGLHFGLRYLPSVDAENRLRERIRDYLKAYYPKRLHALEWYVGMYAENDSFLFPKQAVFQDKGGKGAEITIGIKSVTHLNPDRTRFADGVATVKVRVLGSTKLKAKAAGAQGTFLFDQASTFTVKNPGATALRIKVFLNGDKRAGECYLSLSDLTLNRTVERTHYLVMHAQSTDAHASGFVTVTLSSSNYGTTATGAGELEVARYRRMCRYFYYYFPGELIMADIRYSNTLHMDAYLKQLVEGCGPEPQDLTALLHVGEFVSAVTVPLRPYFVVHIGMEEFRSGVLAQSPATGADVSGNTSTTAGASTAAAGTSSARKRSVRPGVATGTRIAADTRTHYKFDERFELPVGLPERDQIELILYNHSTARDNEIGRATMKLSSLYRMRENQRSLPLVFRPGTPYTEVSGHVTISVKPLDFGTVRDPADLEVPPPSSLMKAKGADRLTAQPQGVVRSPSGAPRGSPALQTAQSTVFYSPGDEGQAAKLHTRALGTFSASPSFVLPEGSEQSVVQDSATVSPWLPRWSPGMLAAAPVGNDSALTSTPRDGFDNNTSISQGAVVSHGNEGSDATDDISHDESDDGTSAAAQADPSTSAINVTVLRFEGLAALDKDVIVRVTHGDEELLLTKPLPPKVLSHRLKNCSFMFGDSKNLMEAALTLKLSTRGFFSNDTLCYADFCLLDARISRKFDKCLRLFTAAGVFVGYCYLRVEIPPAVRVPGRRSDAAALDKVDHEQLLDDLCTLMQRYSPKDLRRLDTIYYRSSNVRKLHSQLRTQLAPSVAATVFVAVRSIELVDEPRTPAPTPGGRGGKPSVSRTRSTNRDGGGNNSDEKQFVRAALNDYVQEEECGGTCFGRLACTFLAGSPHQHNDGASDSGRLSSQHHMHRPQQQHQQRQQQQQQQALECPPLRVDVGPSSARTNSMALSRDPLALVLSVRRGQRRLRGGQEVARAVVSLRALLTPQLFTMSESVTVPLVSVRRASNRVHATLAGRITFFLFPVMYESYPSAVRFSSASVEGFNQLYMRYYFERICNFLNKYDANALVDVHAMLYDRFARDGRWAAGLPQYLSDLVMRWGPEPESTHSVISSGPTGEWSATVSRPTTASNSPAVTPLGSPGLAIIKSIANVAGPTSGSGVFAGLGVNNSNYNAGPGGAPAVGFENYGGFAIHRRTSTSKTIDDDDAGRGSADDPVVARQPPQQAQPTSSNHRWTFHHRVSSHRRSSHGLDDIDTPPLTHGRTSADDLRFKDRHSRQPSRRSHDHYDSDEGDRDDSGDDDGSDDDVVVDVDSAASSEDEQIEVVTASSGSDLALSESSNEFDHYTTGDTPLPRRPN